jgi:hypothetical protein
MNLAKDMQDQLVTELSKVPFTHERLTPGWMAMAKSALRKKSPLALGIRIADYKAILELEAGDPVTMMQYSILNNNLENCSMLDLSLQLDAYSDLMEDCEVMSEAWNAETLGLRKQVEADILARYENTVGKPVGGMKAVPKKSDA